MQYVVEDLIRPRQVQEQQLVCSTERTCQIRNLRTDKFWNGSRIQLRGTASSANFRCWELTSSVHLSKTVFIFGVKHRNGSYRYVTLDEKGSPYKLKPSTVRPELLNIDANEEQNDPRAFIYDIRSNLLISAADQSLHACLSFARSTPQVVADDKGDTWMLHFE